MVKEHNLSWKTTIFEKDEKVPSAKCTLNIKCEVLILQKMSWDVSGDSGLLNDIWLAESCTLPSPSSFQKYSWDKRQTTELFGSTVAAMFGTHKAATVAWLLTLRLGLQHSTTSWSTCDFLTEFYTDFAWFSSSCGLKSSNSSED